MYHPRSSGTTQTLRSVGTSITSLLKKEETFVLDPFRVLLKMTGWPATNERLVLEVRPIGSRTQLGRIEVDGDEAKSEETRLRMCFYK